MMTDRQRIACQKALRITGSFEGASWGGGVGNFDGAGISLFILQWNFLSTLPELLVSMFQSDPQAFNDLLGKDKTNILMALLNTGLREDLQTLVSQITQGKPFDPAGSPRLFSGGVELLSDWKAGFEALGSHFQQQQTDAAENYFEAAISECQNFGLTTERSLVFMFDQCVQQGRHSLSQEREGISRRGAIARVPTGR